MGGQAADGADGAEPLLHRRVRARFEGSDELFLGVVEDCTPLEEGSDAVGVQFDDGDYDDRVPLASVVVLPELSAKEARGGRTDERTNHGNEQTPNTRQTTAERNDATAR
jgi:hypothetical protein